MKIDVLDKGYVRLIDSMGDDLRPINAARASYEKESSNWSDADARLNKFLLNDENGPRRLTHDEPYRHPVLTFEVKAPMLTKNQWWKYLIGHHHQALDGETFYRDPFLAWSESSRRYVTSEPTFYIPRWRSKPENKKQGSGAPLDDEQAELWDGNINDHIMQSLRLYELAMQQGIAPEQARGFLPAYLLYIRWYWTASLWGVIHLLRQRKDADAQWEFREYANAVEALTAQKFPYALEAARGIIDG